MIEWNGLQIAHAQVVLAAPGKRSGPASLYAQAVDGLATGRLQEVRLDCRTLAVDGDRLGCADGTLSGAFGAAGRQDSPIAFSVTPGGPATVRIGRLAVAAGVVTLDGRLDGRRFDVAGTAAGVDLEQLVPLIQPFELLPAGMTLGGRLSGSFDASGTDLDLLRVEGTAELDGLALADAAGSLAAEQLAVTVMARLERPDPSGDWQVALEARSGQGQAYLEPVFVDLGQHPLTARIDARLAADASRLAVRRIDIEQAGILKAHGDADLDLRGEVLLSRAHILVEQAELAGVVPVLAAPFLISTQFADLAGSGTVAGEVDVAAGLPTRLDLTLSDVVLDSTTGSLAVEGLAGRVTWHDEALRNALAPNVDSEIFKSRLDWRSARLWGIEFGQAGIPFTTTGRGFRLLDPVLLPVFDGGLSIATLRIRNAGTPRMYLRFDAEVKPISVAPISRALGLPQFSGTISGSIPRLELSDGLVTLGGNLEARVFDGQIVVRNLRMRDPLGEFPQLFADIDIDALDLQQLTDTFEFGMITGRLSGRVAGLELFNWMPVAFDARLYSTPGDKTKRRISQRAVQNLSSIGGGSGGGVAAALQGGFLRFFDSFRYKRLGLSCQLVNDVCRMDGVAPAPGGYYIVQGSGLPRISVIGNQSRVAWSRLVSQLAAMAETSGPVVE